ncbi:hypothetical protein PS858_05692 [Pseudomonas fluorescens]|nr:hypothetical protein PS858_05692 [Pseudomonas fluorescens]
MDALPIRVLFQSLPITLKAPMPVTVTFSTLSRLFWLRSITLVDALAA